MSMLPMFRPMIDGSHLAEKSAPVVPIHTFIWKIASRCNLNCSYCFVYNKGDSRWRAQPRLMSRETARRTCERMLEHFRTHGKTSATVIFHGGEPFMGGAAHLRMLVETIREMLDANGVTIRLGVQSNGTLFDDAIGDYCIQESIDIGVSIDGPPEYNGQRVDHRGRPSSSLVERKLKLMAEPKYQGVFSGFLVVIDPEADPVRIFDYLAQYAPYSIDFLLPYDNHDRRPKLKDDLSATPYGDWLVRLFDHWFDQKTPIRIRTFNSIIGLLFGGHTLVESTGLDAVDIVVVETNGAIEAVDSLKAVFEGITDLGMNVTTHSFDDVSQHPFIAFRNMGMLSVADKCKGCGAVRACGGGYLPNRYSATRGFDNESVYCTDLYKLVSHIRTRVRKELFRAGVLRVGGVAVPDGEAA